MIEHKWKVIDRDWLKIIAIIAMTMDHVAGSFLINGSVIWLIFRIIGRITFPLMAYMLADGFNGPCPEQAMYNRVQYVGRDYRLMKKKIN